MATQPDVRKPITYGAPPRPRVPPAWHVGPVAKVTRRSRLPPRLGTSGALAARVAMTMKRWMRNESLLQTPWPGRLILFLWALQLHLHLILTGIYPRAQVRLFTTPPGTSAPHNTMQKPCIHRNLTPRLLNNTHTPVGQFVFFACMSSGASLDERLCKSEIIEGTELCLGVCVRRWRPSWQKNSLTQPRM